MTLQLGDTAPDFTAETTEGPLQFHPWLGDHWCLFFSHPKDFTPVCTTELGSVARIKPELDRRHVKVLGISIDTLSDHILWKKDIEETQKTSVTYPMIADPDLKIAQLYGMIHENALSHKGPRTAADNATVRNVFVIDPQKKIRLILVYPMSTGRNFDELLRVIDSLQLTTAHPVATPANWVWGQDVIVANSLSNEDAEKRFPSGWQTIKPYLRMVKQPGV